MSHASGVGRQYLHRLFSRRRILLLPLLIILAGVGYSAIAAGNSVAQSSADQVVIPVPQSPAIISVTSVDNTLVVVFAQPAASALAGRQAPPPILTYEYSTDGGVTFWTRTDGGTTASPMIISATSASRGTTPLAPGVDYDVTIRAVNEFGPGPFPAPQPTSLCQLPGSPSAANWNPVAGNVQISFTAPGSDGGCALTNYEYSTDAGNTWAAASPATTSSPLTIATTSGTATALTPGTTYNVQLRAVNAAGAGAASGSIAVIPGTPQTPTILNVSSLINQISVQFNPGVATLSPITTYAYTTDGGVTWANLPDGTLTSPILITNTSTTGSALVPGTSYLVGLRSVSALGRGPASPLSSVTVVTNPNAPTLTSVTAGNASLDLNFTVPTSNGGAALSTYEYTTDDGVTTKSVAASQTSPWTITQTSSSAALVNGQSYSVKMRATNIAGGVSPWSSAQTATPLGAASAPTISGITANTDGTLTIVFTAPTDNGGSSITNYQYSTNNCSTWATRSPASTSSPWTITVQSSGSAFSYGTAYNICVRAVTAFGAGTSSSATSATPGLAPGTATIGTITPASGSLSVAFTNPAQLGTGGIVAYRYSTDGGATWQVKNPIVTTSPLVITETSDTGAGLVNGQSYSVTISAGNLYGWGPAATAVTSIPGPPPAAPVISGATGGNLTIAVAFTTPSDNGNPIVRYEYSTNGGTTWRTTPQSTSPTTLTTQSGGTLFVKNTSYNVTLRAVNAAGASVSSNSVAVTVLGVPDPPTNGSATAGVGQLALSFTAPVNTGGTALTGYQYRVYRNGTAPTNTWIDIATTPTSFTVTQDQTGASLIGGQLYVTNIRAVNSVGNSSVLSVNGTPTTQAPTAPTITAITPTTTSLSVAFTAPTGNVITNYQYSTDNGTTWRARSSGTTASPLVITTTSAANTALVADTTYQVRIRAINSAGNGTQSNAVSGQLSPAPAGFVTTWDLSKIGTNNLLILPLRLDGTYNFTVNWGDGSATQTVTSADEFVAHTYASAGPWDVTITGTIEGFALGEGDPGYCDDDSVKMLMAAALTEIKAWGSLKLANHGCTFANAVNLTKIPTSGGPTTTGVTNVHSTFANAHRLTTGSLAGWNASSFLNMSYFFANTDSTAVDLPFATGTVIAGLNSWDVSKVLTLSYAFMRKTTFSSDLSGWNTAALTDLTGTFFYATGFNQNLGAWDVADVTTASGMLCYALGMSTTNYSALLNGWAAQTTRNNVTLDATGVRYSAAGAAGRATLVGRGWSITDGGQQGALVITPDATPTPTGAEPVTPTAPAGVAPEDAAPPALTSESPAAKAPPTEASNPSGSPAASSEPSNTPAPAMPESAHAAVLPTPPQPARRERRTNPS